jgi:hypothetical protein
MGDIATSVGIPAMPRKKFLVDAFNGGKRAPDEVLTAKAEPFTQELYPDAPSEVRALYCENDIPMEAHRIKLTMPDGSEWLVDEDVWEHIGRAVKAAREYREANG